MFILDRNSSYLGEFLMFFNDIKNKIYKRSKYEHYRITHNSIVK